MPARARLDVCLTFDIDVTDFAAGGRPTDELDQAVPALAEVLADADCVATWCVRMDQEIARRYGAADALFREHRALFAALSARGHELAWHPHCYTTDDPPRQCVDEAAVLAELTGLVPSARALGLTTVRMGWGFHTSRTLALVADAGFTVDSSAIPRPRYPWELSHKDWTGTPPGPYRPSRADYRVPGTPALPLLEVPLSVAEVRAPYDSGPVLRYLDPAYHAELFAQPLADWVTRHPLLVTITHPYEVGPRPDAHGLLAFAIDAFRANLAAIRRAATETRFLTLSQCAGAHGSHDAV